MADLDPYQQPWPGGASQWREDVNSLLYNLIERVTILENKFKVAPPPNKIFLSNPDKSKVPPPLAKPEEYAD